jgi:2Fe-2S ferredoxin
MLGICPDRADDSRLSCQIEVGNFLVGIVVRLPEFQM